MNLGIRPAEFYRLELDELADLRGEHRAREIAMDRRFGEIAALIGNAMRDRQTYPEPFQPADYFPRVERRYPRPQTQEEIQAALTAAFGGATNGETR